MEKNKWQHFTDTEIEADKVTGYSTPDHIYCPECCPPSITGSSHDPAPIFASDDQQGGHCFWCGRLV